MLGSEYCNRAARTAPEFGVVAISLPARSLLLREGRRKSRPLPDRCGIARRHGHGPVPARLLTRTTYIEPGAPWENPYVESFNGRVRDELLNLEEFTSLTVAQVVVEAWRIEYNTYRPHSALGGRTPAEYKANWTKTQPQLS